MPSLFSSQRPLAQPHLSRQLTVIMGFSKYTAFVLFALRAVSVFAADAVSQ